MNKIIFINEYIFHLLHSLAHRSYFWDAMIGFVANHIDIFVFALVVGFLMVHHHANRPSNKPFFSGQSYREMLLIITSVLIAWAFVELLKMFFAAPRPFLWVEGLEPLFLYGGNDSFPSGHATVFAALASGVWLYHRRIGVVLGLFAFMIGLARIIAGVHFPVDIVFGWFFGLSVPIAVQLLVYRFKEKDSPTTPVR